MNIQTGNSSYQAMLRQTLSITDRPSFVSHEPTSSGSADKVTLGTSSNFHLGETLKWGGIGAVPALGAVSNFVIGAVTGVANQQSQSNAAFLGMAANVLGTGALVTGLIIGSNATTLAGAGLLVGSGVAGGYAVQ